MSFFKFFSHFFSGSNSEQVERSNTFIGRKVKEYNINDELSQSSGCALRLSVGYDEYESGETVLAKLQNLVLQEEVDQVESLIFGPWGEEYEIGPEKLVDFLIENKDKFSHLTSVFFGDIEQEECEMSWIIQCDYEQFLKSFPKLQHFKVRGSSSLSLGEIEHLNLLSLVVESGGLPTKVINSVIEGNIPSLKYLIFWLGVEEYGFDGSIDTVKSLLNLSQYPKLEYLGLRNSEIADGIAKALPDSAIIAQLKILDLSLGTLGDDGGQSILDNNSLQHLELLDLRFHYMSSEMMNKMNSLSFPVNVDEQQEADIDDGEEWRYVAVSE